MKKYIPFTLAAIVFIYVIPFIISKTPVISGLTNMVTVIANTYLLTIAAMLYGRSHRFSILLPVIVITLVVPYALLNEFTVFRLAYVGILYTIATLVGNLTGLMFKKKQK